MEILAIANDLIFVQGAGLGDLTNSFIKDWIGPIFIAIVAVVAIIMLWQRKLMAFASFALVAVLASIFIFAGDDLFGEGGNLSGAGKGVTDKISAN